MSIRVLIVDDSRTYAAGIKRILEGAPDFEVVGFAEDGVQGLAKVHELQPHVVLMDVNIPGASGGKGVPLARATAPIYTRFYLFSACDESKLRQLAREHKADGYLSKSLPVAEVSRKLRELSRHAE